MAADPQKRARFIEDVKKLIKLGFDGIDIDWEYPGPFSGMNFKGSEADYGNFLTLMQEIRKAIGPDKYLTAAFSANKDKLKGFDWQALNQVMDYYNFMTYDFNGGWSNIAGHNSPVYSYSGEEYEGFNWEALYQHLKSTDIDLSKVTLGMAFYGRAVVTKENAALNAATKKVDRTIQPDGAISSAADWNNFGQYEGTPNYFFIMDKTSNWTQHWDEQAMVPYRTNGTYFVSYDDQKSIAIKAQYIKDRNLAGTIVWQVYGDLNCSGGISGSTKLPKCNAVNAPLINVVDAVFTK